MGFRRKRKIITALVFLALVLVLILGAAALPWKPLLERQLTALLEQRGFENVHLSIAGVGWNKIVLKDVSLGKSVPFILKNAAVDYDFTNRIPGGMTLGGLAVSLRRDAEGRWAVGGLEGAVQSPEPGARLRLPVAMEQIVRVPFERIAIEDSTADFTTDTWQAFVPLRLDWEKAPVPKITYSADGVVFKRGKIHAVANGVKADAALDGGKQAWRGAWSAEKINIAGTPVPVPPLHGGGTIEAAEEHITVAGNLRSDDGAYAADFSLSRPLVAGGKTLLTVTRAAMPWKEGNLAARGIRVTLGTAQKTNFNLEVAHVSIGALMQSLTGEKVTATGAVSGAIPVTIGKDGAVDFGQGTLTAEGPGSIVMPPEAIPGDNEQIALVRDIMKDFRYSQLAIAMDPAAEKGLSVMLTVEGSNPAVYNGRSVKLNVRLTGDVLDFIRQNIIFLTDPETLLEQGGAHEKN